MSTKLYILPIVTALGRAPKYLPARLNPGGTLLGMEGTTWALHDYVLEDVTVVAVEATDVQHVLLASQPDVYAVPPLDDAMVAGAAQQLGNFIEAHNIPSGWLQSGQTYRFALRTVLHIFYYYNRIAGSLGASLFSGGITLNSQVRDLSPEVQARMVSAAQSLGLDSSGITANTTLRQVLRDVTAQLDTQPVLIGGTTTELVSI